MNEADVALKPTNLTMEEAASIPLVGLTAWQALVELAGLTKGQKVLIHAGSGGVGTFAIQLAKHLGAIVATTTSTANVELVKSLGADIVVDYKKEDFEKVLSGYDVVLNSLDSETLHKSLNVLKPGEAYLDLRPAGPGFCCRTRSELGGASALPSSEFWHSQEGQAPSRQLFVPIHARQRRAVEPHHVADRSRNDSSRHGSCLPVRSDQRSVGPCGNRTVKGQGRRQCEMKKRMYLSVVAAWERPRSSGRLHPAPASPAEEIRPMGRIADLLSRQPPPCAPREFAPNLRIPPIAAEIP